MPRSRHPSGPKSKVSIGLSPWGQGQLDELTAKLGCSKGAAIEYLLALHSAEKTAEAPLPSVVGVAPAVVEIERPEEPTAEVEVAIFEVMAAVEEPVTTTPESTIVEEILPVEEPAVEPAAEPCGHRFARREPSGKHTCLWCGAVSLDRGASWSSA